jgi:hypothetical protein
MKTFEKDLMKRFEKFHQGKKLANSGFRFKSAFIKKVGSRST